MQTLILLSQLQRIKNQHMDFLCVHVLDRHDNGSPSRMSAPLVSCRLNTWMSYEDQHDLRELLIAILGKNASATEAFTSKIGWNGDQKLVRFVPLSDRTNADKIIWACFPRDGFDIGHW